MRWIRERFALSCVRACRLGGISRAGWYRKSTAKDQSALRMRIREIAQSRPRFGYLRIRKLPRQVDSSKVEFPAASSRSR